jgi:hypothetical protein
MWKIWRQDAFTVLTGKSEGNEPKDLGVDRRIIIKRVVHKKNWTAWIEFIWLGIGTSGGLL